LIFKTVMRVFYHFLLSFIIGCCFIFEAWACEPFPTNVRFTDIQANSAIVSWQQLGHHYVYQVSWREKNTTTWNTSPILPANKDQYRLQSLREGIEYEVQVRSKCISKAVFSPYAPTSLGFLTQSRLCAESQPSAPRRIGIRSIGENQATIFWENLPDAAGVVVSYALASHRLTKVGTDTTRISRLLDFVQTDINTTVAATQWSEVLICAENRSTVLRNLQPNTRYMVRLRTLCTDCQTQGSENKSSKWSGELEFTTLNEGDLVFNAVVSGKVYDEFLRPVAQAQVTVGRQTTQTDNHGRYYLTFARQERTLVKVEHRDFLTRTVGFHPTQADTVYCSVLMDQFKVTHTFNGRDGMLLGNTAFTVQLPENSIIDERTRLPYTGTVKACIQSARPGDPLFGERMPGGDFLAINSEGETRVLYSYGFFGCELRGDNNQPLNLAPGKKAQVAFQITEEQEEKALPTMPLWHYDEEESIWKEEGFTTKHGNTYIGEVSHFSSWNCDWPGKRAWVEGYLTLCGGNAAKGGIVYADNMPAEADHTGFYRRWIPAGFPYPISIYTKSSEERHELAPNLPEDQTSTVPNLDFIPIRAVGIANGDSLQLFASVIGEKNTPVNMEYSLDSIVWQGSPSFTHLPEQYKLTGYVRATNMTNCVVSVDVIIIGKVCQHCGLSRTFYALGSCSDMVISEYIENLNEDETYGGRSARIVDATNLALFRKSFGLLGCLNNVGFVGNNYGVNSSVINMICELSYLQGLEINNYTENQLPDRISKLSHLQKLIIRESSLFELPSTFKNLKSLKYLNITGAFSNFPIEILDLDKLSYLAINGGAYSQLPARIDTLSQLQHLNLLDCRSLTSIPVELTTLTRLESFSVEGSNLLSVIPPEIGNLTQLRNLGFNSCASLQNIPSEIGNLTQLNMLSFSYCRSLRSLPPEIANLRNNLRILYLYNCPISEVEKAKIRAWLPNTTIYF